MCVKKAKKHGRINEKRKAESGAKKGLSNKRQKYPLRFQRCLKTVAQ